MVKINKIYTKTGDAGETGLVGGTRVPKDSLRVNAYGDVDELNSFIGAARTIAESELLADIQNELFDIGSLLATAQGAKWEGMPNITDEQIKRLETAIDSAVNGIPELRSFVLPGGTELNSRLHIARAVCRRAERSVLMLHREEPVEKNILVYLNRLSDLLFALARKTAHDEGAAEFLWVMGKKG